jgi:DNA-dependent RNA polymerase auxiliary subunit epsilon
MLFKILDSFFNINFSKLVNFPFDSLYIELENNETVKLINSENVFIIEYKTGTTTTIKYDLSSYKTVNSIQKDLTKNTKKKKTVEQQIFKQNENELISLIKQTNLYFIQTQRLIVKEKDYLSKEIYSVQLCLTELLSLISKKHQEYSKLSEQFELSLGKRLRNKEVKIYSNIEELKNENKILEAKISELKEIGLFQRNIFDDSSRIPDNIDEVELAVLSVNIQDMKNKLKVFDELYSRLKIFRNILNNKRLSYKKLFINPNSIDFFNDNDEAIQVTELSSGEQHEIVLLYELLFKVPEYSIVLIDEPEISLHVVWQKEFLSDLDDIVKIRNFDILLATHSPSIINGNWNLTVELNKDNSNEE